MPWFFARCELLIPRLAGVQKNAIVEFMIALLDQGIQVIRELAVERQDMAGELLLTLAASAPRCQLMAEQIEYSKLGFPQTGRGEFSSGKKVAKTWRRSDGETAICAQALRHLDAFAEYIDAKILMRRRKSSLARVEINRSSADISEHGPRKRRARDP